MGFWLRHRAQALWLITVLAVAVAVSATTWTIAYVLWLERPPFAEPDHLVSVGWTAPAYSQRMPDVSADEFLDLQAATKDFASLASVESVSFWFLKEPERLTSIVAAYVTTNLFDVLGVNATRGRTFGPDDADAATGIPRALITDRLWRRHFQGDLSIVGRIVTVSASRETRSIEVVGVLPAGIWIPGLNEGDSGTVDVFLATPDGRRPGGSASRRIYDRRLLARLHDDVTIAQATDRFTPILQQIDREHPLFNRVRTAHLLSVQEMWFGASRPLLWLLASAAAFVVLVTMANAAGLVSVIASRRSREFAVRAALGATWRRLAAQSLVEMTVIALASFVAAALLTVALTRTFAWLAPQDIPRITALRVDVTAWMLALGLTGALCLLLGMLPVWLRRHRKASDGLHGGLAFTPPRRMLLVRRTMLVVQTAVVLAMLAAAGLVAGTLWRLLDRPLGFDPDGVAIAKVTPSEKYFLDPARYQFAMDEVRRQVQSAPGGRQVALAFNPPLADFASKMQVRFLERKPESVPSKFVTDRFFGVLRTPLLAGRDFQSSDYTGRPVAIVNELFATAYFGGAQAAIGREFDFGPRHQIIGVVANIREEAVSTPLTPVLYPLFSALMGRTTGYFHVVSREDRPGPETVRTIEDAVRRADPTLHVEASFLSERLRAQTAIARTQSAVLAVLAGVTLSLALLGIYATMWQIVEDRRREMAIRSTLGATPQGLVTLVMRGMAMVLGAGLVSGCLLSWIVAAVTRQFLYDMSPFDARVWSAAATMLMASAGLAAWLPARRAGQVNPIGALKEN